MKTILTLTLLALLTTANAATIYLDNYNYVDKGFAVGKLNIRYNATPTIAMCLNYTQHVAIGTNWEAAIFLASDLDIKYSQAGFLFDKSLELNDAKIIGDIQRVAWYLVGATPALDSKSQAWYDLARSQTVFSDYLVFQPAGAYGQEFISPIPEPNTVTLVIAVGIFFLILKPRRQLL